MIATLPAVIVSELVNTSSLTQVSARILKPNKTSNCVDVSACATKFIGLFLRNLFLSGREGIRV